MAVKHKHHPAMFCELYSPTHGKLFSAKWLIADHGETMLARVLAVTGIRPRLTHRGRLYFRRSELRTMETLAAQLAGDLL